MASYFGWDVAPSALLAFTPAIVMADGNFGVWYDPSDMSTMFQDAAGTIPVTADSQPVGRINDKGPKGYHMTQSVAAARPIFRQLSGKRFLETTTSGQHLATAGNAPVDLTNCRGFLPFMETTEGIFSRPGSIGATGQNDAATSMSLAIHTQTGSGLFGLRAQGGLLDPSIAGSGPTPLDNWEYYITPSEAGVLRAGGSLNVDNALNGQMSRSTGRLCMFEHMSSSGPNVDGQLIGRVYGWCHVGRTLTATEITNMRNWFASKI